MNNISRLTLAGALIASLSACSSSNSVSEESTDTTAPSAPVTMRLLRIENTASDGSVSIIVNSFTESGALSKQVFTLGDRVTTSTFVTNGDGTITSRSTDNDKDGVEDEFSTYEYGEGAQLQRINRFNADGSMSHVLLYRFEADKAVARDRLDAQGITSIDLFDETTALINYRLEYLYEEDRLSGYLLDTDGDGSPEQSESFTYNPNGTAATSARNALDGGAVRATVYTYEPGECKHFGNSDSNFYCVTIE